MRVALLGLIFLTAPLFVHEASKGEVFGGYEFTKFGDGISVKRLNGNGWDAGFAYYFSRWPGAKADFSGAYATDDTSSSVAFRVTDYTYTFAPVISAGNSLTPDWGLSTCNHLDRFH